MKLHLESLETRCLLSVDLVRDIRLGLPSSTPDQIVEFQGQAFFTAEDGVRGRQLWKSDGTKNGTTLVRDLGPGDRVGPQNLEPVGETLYFSLGGEQLWRTDGSTGGTELVYDFYGATPCPRLNDFTALGKSLLFTFWDVYDYGRCPGKLSYSELYITDGTEAGTVQLLRRGTEQPISNLKVSGDKVFFTYGSELWVTDGTVSGTRSLYRFAPGGAAYELTPFYGGIFFTANDGVHGRELWGSDGTPEGTWLVTDLRPGSASAFDSNLAYPYLMEFHGEVYFTATDGQTGFELYKSNGTAEGTSLVADIHYGPASGAPRNLTNADWMFYFTADDGVHGRELWASFGTPETTYLVRDLNPTGDAFPANQFTTASLTEVAWGLFFVATDGQTGWELWSSYGLDEWTYQVRDIVPGPGSSLDPRLVRPYLADVNDRLFFAADDGEHGVELWSMVGRGGEIGSLPDLVGVLSALERRGRR